VTAAAQPIPFSRHNIARGIAFAALAASCYALVPNLARYAVLAGLPALESVSLRTLIVAIVLALAALALGRSVTLPATAYKAFTAQTLATLAVSACYIGSLQFIPVGLSVLIFFTFPIMVVLVSPLVEGRRLSLPHTLLAILAFSGLAIAIGPSFERLNGFGIFLAALAAVGCAVQSISGRQLSRHIDPIVFGSMVHSLILPIVVFMAMVTNRGQFELLQPDQSWVVVGSALAMGFAYCAGYFCQMSAVKAAPASVVIPYFNLEPVLSTLIAFLFLNETLTALHLAGAAMVIGALFAISFIDSRRTRAAA
jgi:drug/metabolite transporter (DMT)-like permease